jgi:alpha-tubulin suppressor-like RCC1 family protein
MVSSLLFRRTGPRIARSIQNARQNSTSSTTPRQQYLGVFVAVAASGVVALTLARSSQPADAEQAPVEVPTIFEPKRPRVSTKEANRELISPQHVQAKQSWDNPGVYAWGLNSGKVAAPESEERWVKTPRRLPFFDGILLRDLKLESNFGAAINEAGDLLLWGSAYSKNSKTPEVSLKGRNLRSLAISEDRVIALSENGTVYSVPVSKDSQAKEPKIKEPSWFWTNSFTNVAARDLTPADLAIGEKVVNISSGLEHLLMLTSRGRVYSAASSSNDFPKYGQLGVPGLNWFTRPSGPYDQPHELKTLKGTKIEQIATGDTHSLLLDKHGKVYSFGENSYGQLGLMFNPENMDLNNALNINTHYVDVPTEVPIAAAYPPNTQFVNVRSIAAGGLNSFIIADSRTRNSNTVSSDALACGRGIWGALGNGKLTHIQWTPTKIPALSGMIEYNEETGKSQPIRVSSFQVGGSHVAAVMANITRVAASDRTGENDTNYGADVYFFGNNEHFQIGNGKRANLSVPTHIQPLNQVVTKQATGSEDVVKEFDRFQLTPPKKITFAGRSVWVEQRVVTGRQCSAVYSAVL